MFDRTTTRRTLARGPRSAPLVAGLPLRRGLTWAAGLSSALAAGATWLAPDALRGEPVMVGCLRGTALVVLLVVPLLLAASTRQGPGPRALTLWVATLAYLLYQAVMFCFATPMNRFFLAYVAMLATTLWALAVLVLGVDRQALTAALSPQFPLRTLAGVVGTAAFLNVVAWLAQAAPVSWSGDTPAVVVQSGLPTSVTWVQDLTVWLPTALVLAVLGLRGRRSTGAWLLALTWFYALEAFGVASDQWWGARADATHPALASTAAAGGALVVAVLLAGLASWATRRTGSSHPAMAARHERRGVHAALAAVTAVTSVAAVVGSVQLVTGTFTPPVTDLAPLGLDTWVLPGLWLFATVAVPCGVVAVSAWRRSPETGSRAFAAAALLVLELVVQIPFVGPDPLQLVMGAVAVLVVALGRAAQRSERGAGRLVAPPAH